jgi:aminopeptidase N
MTFLKTSLIAFGLLCLSFNLLIANNLSDKLYQEGVSEELATKRKAEVKDIVYTLFFAIPKTRETNVRGTENISFSFRGKTEDVILDFKATDSQIKKVTVNGKKSLYTFKQEHIIIKSALLKKGKNNIAIEFVAGNKPLNRNDDYMYTLFVPDHARQAFPCFDQPDLKAHFRLSLTVPRTWEAVSGGKISREKITDDTKHIIFAETELIPTYLFSFVTGKFDKKSCIKDGREVTAYYRENNQKKLMQLPTIFNQVFSSIRWLEKYTGMAYPFSKYDLVILPGFQFGGMEHVGAVLYNDKRIFISERPTPDEELNRAELIAHETAHSWFGDMVTMKWFNDVWTKEVFANYMAAKMSKEQFPNINQNLNFLKSYQIYALADDRTDGTHPIQQQLDNLQNAGLLYGNIIYDKAPVMMRKLEQQMGSEAFRRGIQKYLKTYAFDNADWDNLIFILDRENSKANLRQFSEVWVKQKGLPNITVQTTPNAIKIEQADPYHRGCIWQQKFKVATVANGTVAEVIEVNMQNKSATCPTHKPYETVIPNYDGMGYGRFIVDKNSTQNLLSLWQKGEDINREAMLISIYENFLMHKVSAIDCTASLLEGLKHEKNDLIASTCCNYLATTIFFLKNTERHQAERAMWEMSKTHAITSCRQKLTRTLFSLTTDSTIIKELYQLWSKHENPLLAEDDYMALSYQLAIRMPDQWQSILNRERKQINGSDRLREFDYISRGCNPDKAAQGKLFESLLHKENRTIEPWTQKLLSLLNSELREPYSNSYITPGLNILKEIQRTGDIFFPKGWLSSLLSGHKSEEAKELVKNFIASNKEYPTALMNKLLQAAFFLLNK